ncbi:MAG TPA: histidine kinase [Longimicrobiaceae bacterium]|nr:histidine kinase [Longimicrobiaceae bacterium]
MRAASHDPPLPLRRRLLPWALLVAAWSVPGVLAALQVYAASRAGTGIGGVRLSLAAALLWQLPVWLFWAAATPLIAWLTRRFPVGEGRGLRFLPLHAVLAVAFATAAEVNFGVFASLAGLTPPPQFAGGPLGVLRAILSDPWMQAHVALYGLVAGAAVAVSAARRYRERDLRASQLEAQLAQAQLEALRAQMHPHFLFNALNTVAMLVRAGETPRALEVLVGFSELLRHVLYETGTAHVTLRDEVEFVRRYLEIERVRFGDRLRVEIEADPDALDARVPNLLLQPLVENALRHGVAGRSAGGTVRVRARRRGPRLHLSVEDDGAGLPPAWTMEGCTGVGLANVRGRVERLYGSGGLLRVSPRQEGGVVATVELPFEPAELPTPALELA